MLFEDGAVLLEVSSGGMRDQLKHHHHNEHHESLGTWKCWIVQLEKPWSHSVQQSMRQSFSMSDQQEMFIVQSVAN